MSRSEFSLRAPWPSGWRSAEKLHKLFDRQRGSDRRVRMAVLGSHELIGNDTGRDLPFANAGHSAFMRSTLASTVLIARGFHGFAVPALVALDGVSWRRT